MEPTTGGMPPRQTPRWGKEPLMAQDLGEFNALGMTTGIVFAGAKHGQTWDPKAGTKGQWVEDVEKGQRMWIGDFQLEWDPKVCIGGYKRPSFVELRMRGQDLVTNPFEELGIVPGTRVKFAELILHITVRERKQTCYFTYKEVAPA